MSDEGEGFLRRWARRKTETRQGIEPAPEPEAAAAPVRESPPVSASVPASVPACAPDAVRPAVTETRLPTMDDVAQLQPDSDFSAFVARGVDQAVRRGALKKLFADPHFKVLDRLDMYMDDYNKPSPMSDEMLAALKHSKSLFDSLIKDVAPADELDGGAGASVTTASVTATATATAVASPETTHDTTTTTPPEQETP